MSAPLPVPPDEQQDAVREGESPARGKLKIFFGAFPGVGKTFAMLLAGRRMRDAGRDVVIGVADTHAAPDTETLLEGFEVIAPPVVGGKPSTGELDLDKVIERKPDVVLVDNLAHANPQGARHPHRWNDVDEILGNGIDVFSAMSVQHLDSLADVVSEITGVPASGETVPDTFFDSAEETVIVDMSADELLARLRAGKVLGPEVNSSSAAKFFRKGNLLALREIALRRTADVVEDEVQRYRAEKAIGAVWKTQGHLLCCIGPAEGGEHVVRSASRLANQLDVPWTAVYVETPRLQRLPAGDRGRILQVVSLAEELGARTAILTGGDAAGAILEYARTENISTILLGRNPRPRFHLLRNLSERLASESDDIDLIEIGAAGRESGPRVTAPPVAPDAHNPRAGEKRLRYAWTTGIFIVATVAALAAHRWFEPANLVMFYLLAVILIAVRWGRGPAIYAAILNVIAFDFFFVPPVYSLRVSDPEYLFTFAVMLAVGVITGQLAGNLRFQARVASHRERRARTLYEFARDLSTKRTTAQVIETTEQFMSNQFRGRVAILVPDATGSLVSPTGRGMTNPFDGTTAQWAYDHAKAAGAGTDTMASNEHLFLPLRSPTRTRGVLAIRPERTRDLMIPEQRHQFDIFAALVATALERVHYVDVARDALLMARIQSRDLALELHPRSIADLAEAAMRSLGPILSRNPVALEIPRDLPMVPVDPKLMERVFVSLIGNVPKHTAAGTRVTVSARLAGDYVEVSVADDGPGLPSGREVEIFESFARGDDQQSPKRGAGLGLAIVRAIIEAHGGSIHAEPGRKKGARVIFTLPLKRP
jgi:two-component system, OmpR family, sensor histidine kinase KdpD